MKRLWNVANTFLFVYTGFVELSGLSTALRISYNDKVTNLVSGFERVQQEEWTWY